RGEQAADDGVDLADLRIEMLEVVQPDGGRQRPYTDGSVEIVQPDGSSFRSMTGMNVADDPLAGDPRTVTEPMSTEQSPRGNGRVSLVDSSTERPDTSTCIRPTSEASWRRHA